MWVDLIGYCIVIYTIWERKTSMSKKIGFLVDAMTDFRYFIPLITQINSLNEGHEFLLDLSANRRKYNGLVPNSNVKNWILDNFLNYCTITDSKVDCDIMFSVEAFHSVYERTTSYDGHSFNYKKHYAIQHGFDWLKSKWNLGFASPEYKKGRDYSKTCYIAHDELYANSIREYGTPTVCPPIPVTSWNLLQQLNYAKRISDYNPEHIKSSYFSDDKLAVVFWPEANSDQNEAAEQIIDCLFQNGYEVIIKQRRKHQYIPAKYKEIGFYDDVWFPSESIFFPHLANVCIGFDTSAYVDLVPVGVNFIDNCKVDIAKTYVRPIESENFHLIEYNWKENTINLINTKKFEKPKFNDQDYLFRINDFLKTILEV